MRAERERNRKCTLHMVAMELESGAGSFYRGNQFQNNNPDWLPTFIAASDG